MNGRCIDAPPRTSSRPATSRLHSVTGWMPARKPKRSSCSEDSLVSAYVHGDGRGLYRIATKVGEAAISEPGRLVDVALALAASAPAGQAAPWISRATQHAGDLSDADRARLVIAQGLVGVQYGEAVDVERALSDHAGSQHLPDDEAVRYGPILAARARLWLGDLDGARAACEQTLDPLAAPTCSRSD